MSQTPPEFATLADVAAHHASTTPDRPALVAESLALSWREVETRTRRLAARLMALGLSVGDRVAVLSQNRPEVIEVQLACARIGAIFTPLNTRLSYLELRRLMELVEPGALVHDRAHHGLVQRLSPGMRRIDFDGDTSFGYASLVEMPTKLESLEPVDPALPAMMIFTSGTTGTPLGAVLTHRQLAANHRQFLQLLPIDARTVNYAVAPLFHVAGLNTITGPTLLAGGTSVFARRFDPDTALSQIEDFRITASFMVPTMWQDLVAHPRFTDGAADGLEFGLVGGASCPQSVEQSLAERGVPLFEGYGMTEAGPMVTLREPDPHAASPHAVGAPGPDVELRIVDEHERPLDAGDVGELQVRAPKVMSHYWRDRAATEATVRDGWLSTGDLGYLDKGQFHLLDRVDDMINSGAEKVYPSEVEALLVDHPSIDEAAVVGTEHPRWGQMVTAVVVPHPDHTPDLKSLRRHLSGHIARYKCPRRLELVASLPRNGAGKLLRSQVAQMIVTQRPKAS
jgi:fatty-acyl-CoA synthase